MTTQRPAAGRRLHRAVSLAAALLLASLPLAAQNRSRPSESGDTGRTAREAGSSRPSYSPPPSSTPSGGDRSSTSSSPPRTARPSDGGREPHRQPPSRSRGDRDDRGGSGHHHHSGGYYYGGYYPYHYPYGWGNYGFWPGYYGWWWWGGYPSYGYGNYPSGGYYERDRAGALDFDVAPARTEVYLDGEYVGKVDGFDGWPRYLWLPKGTYDVVLYLDGYKTVARQISVYPGSVIQIDDRLEPGESVRPEDPVSKSTERRDERLRYEEERRERMDRGDDDSDEDWRDRVRRDRGRMRDRDDYAERDRNDGREGRDDRGSEEKGRLVLDVEPEDASVYLDGRFVGTGSELALMRDGLPVSPGEHRLAIVRPGRKAEEREFDVEAGEEVEIEVELETESR